MVVLLTVASTFVANKLAATLLWLGFRLFIKILNAEEKAFLFEFVAAIPNIPGMHAV